MRRFTGVKSDLYSETPQMRRQTAFPSMVFTSTCCADATISPTKPVLPDPETASQLLGFDLWGDVTGQNSPFKTSGQPSTAGFSIKLFN
jgi:hypothetical protein